jgi:mono/diheme cytochrome c family protein
MAFSSSASRGSQGVDCRWILCLIAICAAEFDCKKPDQTANTEARIAEAPAPPSYLALNIFRNRCASCHGATGAGDGPAAAGLNPRPRNFADPTWHSRASESYLRRVVLEGGAAVGRSLLMPPSPDLAQQPAVLSALIGHLRQLMRVDQLQP